MKNRQRQLTFSLTLNQYYCKYRVISHQSPETAYVCHDVYQDKTFWIQVIVKNDLIFLIIWIPIQTMRQLIRHSQCLIHLLLT